MPTDYERKTVAFRPGLAERLRERVVKMNKEGTTGPRVSFNWLVNEACERFLEDSQMPRNRAGRRLKKKTAIR